jgi:hypothetical protein
MREAAPIGAVDRSGSGGRAKAMRKPHRRLRVPHRATVRERTPARATVVISAYTRRAAAAKTANRRGSIGNNRHLVASLSRQTIAWRMAPTMQS